MQLLASPEESPASPAWSPGVLGGVLPIRWLFSFLLFLWLTGCRASAPAKTDDLAVDSSRPPALSDRPSGALCDPSRCGAFCATAQCLFGGAKPCLTLCQARCGDAYFEPADQELMECASLASTCDGVKACCQTHFTSHLCRE